MQNIKEAVANSDLPTDQQNDVEAEPNKIGNEIREDSRNEIKPIELRKLDQITTDQPNIILR